MLQMLRNYLKCDIEPRINVFGYLDLNCLDAIETPLESLASLIIIFLLCSLTSLVAPGSKVGLYNLWTQSTEKGLGARCRQFVFVVKANELDFNVL